jgi:hypothetical protein
MRVFLRCAVCEGHGLILYRLNPGEAANPRGRDATLETFLAKHAGCWRGEPFLYVAYEDEKYNGPVEGAGPGLDTEG